MADEIKRVVVATDGSECSSHAARFAGMLARSTGAEIDLIVINDPDAYIVSGVGEAAPLTTAEYEKIYGEELRATFADPAFANATEALGEIPGKIVKDVFWGHPAEAICRYAKDREADLIIVGSRGRSPFTGLLLGSVSSEVLHDAHCPVTVVR